MQAHLLLDAGIDACAKCDHIGPGPYCQHCGQRHGPAAELHTCSRCHTSGPGPYCSACGAVLVSDVQRDMERETFDWARFEQQMSRFTGGLYPAEAAALAGVPYLPQHGQEQP